MPETKFLKCTCESCGGGIEFPAEGIGSTVPCPHCGWQTELKLETPAVETAQRPRSFKWIIAGAGILVVGGVAIIMILIVAQRRMERIGREASQARVVRPGKTNAAAAKITAAPLTLTNGFSVSKTVIEKTSGSSLAYASGSLKNDTDKQRFGVTVELELMDSKGGKIGTAKDYAAIIEPNMEWKFRALLVQKNVAAARVANVKEQE
jgi:hypothetical protein